MAELVLKSPIDVVIEMQEAPLSVLTEEQMLAFLWTGEQSVLARALEAITAHFGTARAGEAATHSQEQVLHISGDAHRDPREKLQLCRHQTSLHLVLQNCLLPILH